MQQALLLQAPSAAWTYKALMSVHAFWAMNFKVLTIVHIPRAFLMCNRRDNIPL